MEYVKAVKEALEIPSGAVVRLNRAMEYGAMHFGEIAGVSIVQGEQAMLAVKEKEGIYNICFKKSKDEEKDVVLIDSSLSDSYEFKKGTEIYLNKEIIREVEEACSKENLRLVESLGLERVGSFRGENTVSPISESDLHNDYYGRTVNVNLGNSRIEIYRNSSNGLDLVVEPDLGWLMPDVHKFMVGSPRSCPNQLMSVSEVVNSLDLSPIRHSRFVHAFHYMYDRLSLETMKVMALQFQKLLWPHNNLVAIIATNTYYIGAVQFKNKNFKFAVFDPGKSGCQLGGTYSTIPADTFHKSYLEFKKELEYLSGLACAGKDSSDEPGSGDIYTRSYRRRYREKSSVPRHPGLNVDFRFLGTEDGMTEEEFVDRVSMLAACNKL